MTTAQPPRYLQQKLEEPLLQRRGHQKERLKSLELVFSPSMAVSISRLLRKAIRLMAAADQAERFMWPGFLAKLRESFSLNPIPEYRDGVVQKNPMVGHRAVARVYLGS